jgi:hypothetical protein
MNFDFVGAGSLIIFNNRLSSSISARQEKYISADFFLSGIIIKKEQEGELNKINYKIFICLTRRRITHNNHIYKTNKNKQFF